MPRTPAVVLFSTVDRFRHALVPHFVRHYRALGVERFVISAHVDPRWEARTRLDVISGLRGRLHELAVPEMYVFEATYHSTTMRAHQLSLARTLMGRHDWLLWADIDELQNYWAPVPEVVRECVEGGYDAVAGKLVDRVAQGGELVEISPDRPLHEQFPLRANVTEGVLKAGVDKIAVFGPGVKISPGSHFIENADETTTHPRSIDIDHYKWDASVKERLGERVTEEWKARCGWWPESQRGLDHIQQHGRIAV